MPPVDTMDTPTPQSFPSAAQERDLLRRQLRQARRHFASSPQAEMAGRRLGQHLAAVLAQLEVHDLGLFWPMDGEFNPVPVIQADSALARCTLSLPCATRSPPGMVYRAWDGREPTARDDFGLPCGSGPIVVPEVILAPCVGFNAEGYRLGYGGGFFDRWLHTHPGVTVVGVCWALGRCAFTPEAHDVPMTLVVTEGGVEAG